MSNWIKGMLQNDPEKVLEYVSRDLAQAAVALEQIVDARNIRMMGGWRHQMDEKEKTMVLLGHQGANYCQFMLVSYYMPIFAMYWHLREEYAKLQAWRTIQDLHKALQKFRGTFALYRAIHEAFMTIFDIKFDQFHTVTTMLGIPKSEEDKDGDNDITWIAADEDQIEKRKRGRHAARDRMEKMGIHLLKKGDYPDFEQAVELARKNFQDLVELDPIIADFDKFLKEIGVYKDEVKAVAKTPKPQEPKVEAKPKPEKKKRKRKIRTAS